MPRSHESNSVAGVFAELSRAGGLNGIMKAELTGLVREFDSHVELPEGYRPLHILHIAEEVHVGQLATAVPCAVRDSQLTVKLLQFILTAPYCEDRQCLQFT